MCNDGTVLAVMTKLALTENLDGCVYSEPYLLIKKNNKKTVSILKVLFLIL